MDGVPHRRLALASALGALLALVAGCTGAPAAGSLPPTLSVGNDGVALQNGIPVPTFDWQPRPRLDLDRGWRVERATMDTDLSLTDRSAALEEIEDAGGGRHLPDFDHRAWEPISVPGTLNEPPDQPEIGGWYRLRFGVQHEWAGRAITLRFGSANYLADVWLNGEWLGYHEGGYTPFAFDVSQIVLAGEENVLAVRVDNPRWGTRQDIVPWGLADWWNYGGITGPVWLEASPPLHVVRADVLPHLDAADVSVVVGHAELGEAVDPPSGTAEVVVEILPVRVTEDNVLNPDPRFLVVPAAPPVASETAEIIIPAPGEHAVASFSFRFASATSWSPAVPALYVLRVTLRGEVVDEELSPMDPREELPRDTLWTSFGLRHVAVAAGEPRILLNGRPVLFRGVGLHDELLTMTDDDTVLTASRPTSPGPIREQLADARRVGADLVRAGHAPANPMLLMLTDRLGFAVWEEIPLYHATPPTFQASLERGIAQQMLREMALRDMNRPSVLFHGLANESTGEEERLDAMRRLHEVSRNIDGTRLTGQASHGWMPDDATHAPLDVAGFTMYYGVFYGDDPLADTERAIRTTHETFPDKPVVVLEFGRWADTEADRTRQREIFEETYAALERYSAEDEAGFVSVATWWSLHDFATQWPGLQVERFGLIGPDGELRPAGQAAAETFQRPAGAGSLLRVESRARGVPVADPASDDLRFVLLVGFALVSSVAILALALVALTLTGGRATSIVRRAR